MATKTTINAGTQALLLGRQTSQTTTFINLLKGLSYECRHKEQYEAILNELKSPVYAIILADHIAIPHLDILNYLKILSFAQSPAAFVIYNTSTSHNNALLLETLQYPNFRGCFSQDTSSKNFLCGISSIREGEFWIPRKVLHQYLFNIQSSATKLHQETGILTKKQQEILHLIAEGYSNLAIAEKLFVSSHTVKTHIYQIFKKINVGNRVQAVQWLQGNNQSNFDRWSEHNNPDYLKISSRI